MKDAVAPPRFDDPTYGRRFISLTVSDELHDALRKRAGERNEPLGAYARRQLAVVLGLLPGVVENRVEG